MDHWNVLNVVKYILFCYNSNNWNEFKMVDVLLSSKTKSVNNN